MDSAQRTNARVDTRMGIVQAGTRRVSRAARHWDRGEK